MVKPIIIIGTRGSNLALWQAHQVQKLLENLGYMTKISIINSSGDTNLKQPLYEMGVTGIFTKSLDIALLQKDVDIAVHSMKDVPTQLPKGIIQAAVLKRGCTQDTLVIKKDLNEFDECIIATGSLRRKAQWLHKYPHHKIENLRGNLQLRLNKLENSLYWSGAIFAKVGLERLGLFPQETRVLDWMIPAPAQGAIVAICRENHYLKDILSKINHQPSALTTHIERQFLKVLEGGCTAPIGAKATISGNKIDFKAVLLSVDGKKRLDIVDGVDIQYADNIGKKWGERLLSQGGHAIIKSLRSA